MVGFTSYKVDNDKRFDRALDAAIKKIQDLRFAMGEIARDISKTTIQNFTLKGFGQYPPLSPKYKEYKSKVRPSAPILVFDGDLRDSLAFASNKATVSAPTADSILTIGKDFLIQGTKVPYAKYIQEGTSKMPARKYLFIDDAQALRFERIIGDYVASRLEVIGNAS